MPEDALSDEEQHPAEITSDPSNRLKLAWLNLCKSFFSFVNGCKDYSTM